MVVSAPGFAVVGRAAAEQGSNALEVVVGPVGVGQAEDRNQDDRQCHGSFLRYRAENG
jgi:hypothetical protein